MIADRPNMGLRISVLAGIVAVLLVSLVSRLWFLQVLAGDRYSELSQQNAVQVVYDQAPRGRILSSDGTPIVDNRASLAVRAERQKLLDEAGDPKNAEARAVLDRLSRLLDLSVDEIVTKLTDPEYSPFQPVPIALDVPPEVVLSVQEHQELFRGVTAERLPVRAYPRGPVAPHVVGYTGEISQEQLDQARFEGYRPGDIVGQAGLEQSHEQRLRGERGRRVLQVNARGTVLRELEQRAPVPGDDLVTSLDLELQRQVQRLLSQQVREVRGSTDGEGRTMAAPSGAAVVLDVQTGEVLAMASHPTYDPAKFVGGVPTDYFNDVFRDVRVGRDGEDRDDQPQVTDDPDPEPKAGINRAVSEAWAPGSTFKPISAAGFLDGGIITPETSIDCPDTWSQGPNASTKRNWHYGDEGQMTITTALKRSCDTFFYEVADRQWRRAGDGRGTGRPMQRMAREFGYDEPLGIDLPEEVGGIVPDPQWKRRYWQANKDWQCAARNDPDQSELQRKIAAEFCKHGDEWVGGDPVNAAIGQGYLTATPLQLASSYVAIANGGRLMRPHLGVAVRSPSGKTIETIEPELIREVPLSADHLSAIRTGMRQVVMGEDGTATGAFAGFPLDEIPVAGKTGTAEWSPEKSTHAWFGAYAPADDPRIAVVAMVEQGGGGSSTAAPIVRRILEAHFGLDDTPS